MRGFTKNRNVYTPIQKQKTNHLEKAVIWVGIVCALAAIVMLLQLWLVWMPAITRGG